MFNIKYLSKVIVVGVLFWLGQTGIVSSIVYSLCSYMVDAADREKIEASRNELHNLLDKPQLQGIPVRGRLYFLD